MKKGSCAGICALVIKRSKICKPMPLAPKFLKALDHFYNLKEQVTKCQYSCGVWGCANVQLMTWLQPWIYYRLRLFLQHWCSNLNICLIVPNGGRMRMNVCCQSSGRSSAPAGRWDRRDPHQQQQTRPSSSMSPALPLWQSERTYRTPPMKTNKKTRNG